MVDIKKIDTKLIIKNVIKISMIFAGILIYSIGLKWFTLNANILPGGFTGISALIQSVLHDFYKIDMPITILNLTFNIVPAIFSFFLVGKIFTIKSFIILFIYNFIIDLLPPMTLTPDPLVSAIFGGILYGVGSAFWFRCGASGGGTDFVAMTISEKFHISAFGYIMVFNILLIVVQGLIYGIETAFYSIIFQYMSTTAINQFYRHYEARTIFIITEKPTLVSKVLIRDAGHTCTRFDGIGCYSNNEKYMLYTVATQPEVRKITNIVKRHDPNAFINVMKSNEVQGNFKYLPVSVDDIDEGF